MKKYKYEAIDSKGKPTEGIVPSDTFEDVVLRLMQANLYPTRIEELTGNILITHGRLEKLKEIKRRLQPEDTRETSQLTPPPSRSGSRFPKLLLLALLVTWAVMVAVLCYYNSLAK